MNIFHVLKIRIMRPLVAVPLIFLGCTGLFRHTIFPTYGRLDDYVQIWRSNRVSLSEFVEPSLSFGRPLLFGFNGILYKICQSVEFFWVLRLTGLLLFFTGSVLLVTPIYRSTNNRFISFGLGSLIFCMPGTWVFLSWAQGAGHALAFTLAAVAATSIVRSKDHESKIMNLLSIFVPVCLCIFTYQPWGLSVPMLVIALGVITNLDFETIYAKAKVALISTISAFLLNIVIVQLNEDKNLSARTSITNSFEAKFDWIIKELFPRTLLPFSTQTHFGLSLLVALLWSIVVIYLFVKFKKYGKSQSGVAFFLACALFLPLAPLIVIEENWASARALLAGSFSTWFLLISVVWRRFVLNLILGIQKRRLTNLISCLVILLAATGSAIASNRSDENLAKISATEWSNSKAILKNVPSDVDTVYVVKLPFFVPGIKTVSFDEYGILSGSVSWSAPYLYSLALESATGEKFDPTKFKISEGAATCSSGPLIITDDVLRSTFINPYLLWDC
jgi:hypothetical protein